jgi:hypothetical protein
LPQSVFGNVGGSESESESERIGLNLKASKNLVVDFAGVPESRSGAFHRGREGG